MPKDIYLHQININQRITILIQLLNKVRLIQFLPNNYWSPKIMGAYSVFIHNVRFLPARRQDFGRRTLRLCRKQTFTKVNLLLFSTLQASNSHTLN